MIKSIKIESIDGEMVHDIEDGRELLCSRAICLDTDTTFEFIISRRKKDKKYSIVLYNKDDDRGTSINFTADELAIVKEGIECMVRKSTYGI